MANFGQAVIGCEYITSAPACFPVALNPNISLCGELGSMGMNCRNGSTVVCVSIEMRLAQAETLKVFFVKRAVEFTEGMCLKEKFLIAE